MGSEAPFLIPVQALHTDLGWGVRNLELASVGERGAEGPEPHPQTWDQAEGLVIGM